MWCWRWLAENVLGSVGRGDPLLVTGRLRVRELDNGAGQAKGALAEIEAAAIGHDLSRGTSAFRRTVRGRPELVATAADRQAGAQRGAGAAGAAATGPTTAAAVVGAFADRPVGVGDGAGAGAGVGGGVGAERVG